MSRYTACRRVSECAFFGVSALVFATGATVTISRCVSMAAMGGVPMPGNWMLSTVWARMCGETWVDAAASFLLMWIAMTVTMMLPSLLPTLRHYRQTVGGAGERPLGLLTTLVGVGYFSVWSALGIAVFLLGIALAAIEMAVPALAAAVPAALGAVVLAGGALQFTEWKAHHLACCRGAAGHGGMTPAGIVAAWRHGVRLGLHCSYCCAGLTATLLVVGIMNLPAMALVTLAITAERLTPAGERVARAIGGVIIGAGLFLIAQAMRLC